MIHWGIEARDVTACGPTRRPDLLEVQRSAFEANPGGLLQVLGKKYDIMGCTVQVPYKSLGYN